MLSFLTSLSGNSDRNLSDAAHTQAMSRMARRPPPKKFHFKILLNVLQIPAGNTQHITEKGKGVNGQDKTIGKYPPRAAAGLPEHMLCLVGETGWIFVTEGRLVHQTRQWAKTPLHFACNSLTLWLPEDCQCCHKDNFKAAPGFAKNKPQVPLAHKIIFIPCTTTFSPGKSCVPMHKMVHIKDL